MVPVHRAGVPQAHGPGAKLPQVRGRGALLVPRHQELVQVLMSLWSQRRNLGTTVGNYWISSTSSSVVSFRVMRSLPLFLREFLLLYTLFGYFLRIAAIHGHYKFFRVLVERWKHETHFPLLLW